MDSCEGRNDGVWEGLTLGCLGGTLALLSLKLGRVKGVARYRRFQEAFVGTAVVS